MKESIFTYKKYLELYSTTKKILGSNPKSQAYFDFTRAKSARQGYKKWTTGISVTEDEERSYFVAAILPKSGEELSKKEFDRLTPIYGEAMAKIAMIDDNLSKWLSHKNESETILGVGGSCALETVDKKIITSLLSQTDGEKSVKKYIEKMFLRFPTWTQIAGTLIPVKGVSVMYDETFLWLHRISEYGLTDAESATQRVYDGIFEAVKRYVRLFNPNNIVIKIPFSTLNLIKGGQLDRLYDKYQSYQSALTMKYKLGKSSQDPNTLMKSWVNYTYFGPEILALSLDIIKNAYPKIYQENQLVNSTIHVRGKQIDHLDVERNSEWMHCILLDNNKSKHMQTAKRLLEAPRYRQIVSMYAWLRDNCSKNSSIGFTGFLDLACRGKLLHEDSFFSRRELQKYLPHNFSDKLVDSPLRLHSQNIDAWTTLLNKFTNPNPVTISRETLLDLNHFRTKIQVNLRKRRIIKQFISNFSIFENIIQSYLVNQELPQLAFNKDTFQQMRVMMIQRFRSLDSFNTLLRRTYGGNNSAEIFLSEFLDKISIDFRSKTKKSKKMIKGNDFFAVIKELPLLISILKKNDEKKLQKLNAECKEMRMKLNIIYQYVSQDITEYQKDEQLKFIEILPLSNNLFVSYVQQLLFIPSVQLAYLDMGSIEQSTELSFEEKEKMIIESMRRIYSVVIESIKFVMKGGDYPWKWRYEYEYESVYCNNI